MQPGPIVLVPVLRIFPARRHLPSHGATLCLPDRDPTGLTAAGTPPPGLRAARRSRTPACARASSRARRPLAAAAHSRSPRSSRAAPALRTYLRDKVTRLVRPGGRPRVSGAGERAGRGAVRSPPLLLGSWLSASALPCAPLPPPLPSLDRSQRPGLPRAHGSPAPGAGQRRRPSRAGFSCPREQKGRGLSKG